MRFSFQVLLDVEDKEHWSLEDRVQVPAANIEGRPLNRERGGRHLQLAAEFQKISALLKNCSWFDSYNAVVQ